MDQQTSNIDYKQDASSKGDAPEQPQLRNNTTRIAHKSPQKMIASQILEIDQTEPLIMQSLHTQEESVGSPLIVRGENRQQLHKSGFIKGPNDPTSSDLNVIVQQRGVDVSTMSQNRPGHLPTSSIDSHSQLAQPNQQKYEGEVSRILGLQDPRNQNTSLNRSRIDSFDISSPANRSTSNGAYISHHDNTATSALSSHKRAISTSQGKQYLMETGAKAIAGSNDTQLPISPKSNLRNRGGVDSTRGNANFSEQNSMIRMRNQSLSSAGKVIGTSQQSTAQGNSQKFTIKQMNTETTPQQQNSSLSGPGFQHSPRHHPGANDSIQSISVGPTNSDLNHITVTSLHGQNQQPIRLKNNVSVGNSGRFGSSENPILRSGQGQRMSNLSNGAKNQTMLITQYPGQSQSLSPQKRTSMGLKPNNISNQKGSVIASNSVDGGFGSIVLEQNLSQQQTISQGFGVGGMAATADAQQQQRQFQIQQQSSAQNSSRQQISLFQSTTSNSGQNSISKGISGQRMTSGQTSGGNNYGQTVANFVAGGTASGTIFNGTGGNFNNARQQQQSSQYRSVRASNQQLKNNQSATQAAANVTNLNLAQMKPNDAGSMGGPNKPPQQVISRSNPGQGQNSFRGPMNKPSPLKSQGGLMGSRQGVGGLGVTPSSNIHQPNNLGNNNSILGNQIGGQQQMNPLFKMGQGMPPGTNTHGQLHLNHSTMVNGQMMGANTGNPANNISTVSHPSTATFQNATNTTTNTTQEHLNSTVGSHIKGTGDNKDSHAPASNQVPGGPGTLGFGGHGAEGGFKMFERENFKFKDSIMIHVIDDSKNEKRDFTFSRSLLVKYMKYFDRCLKKISDNDEIDISIHCDAVIFEWLLNYIFAMEEYEKKQSEQEKFNRAVGNSVSPNWQLKVHKTQGEEGEKDKNSFANSAIMQYGGPKLDIKNAVTILIPAEFLKIDRLVRECLDFIGEHIEEISRVQVDMSCINTNIIREMAKKVSLDRLDILKERKDKIVSRLFMKKLELLLEKEKNHLYKCAYCNKLFTKKQRKVLSCRKGTSFIDHNGQMRAKHVIDKNWDLKKFVTFVRETYRISWKEIYWKVWSYLHLIKCERCMEFYPIAEMGFCRYHKHPAKPKMSANPFGSQYEYECCKETVSVYQMLNGQKGDHGCQTQLHETRSIYNVAKGKEKKIIDRIIAHQLIILENPTGSFIDAIKLEEKLKSGNVKEGTGMAHTIQETVSGQTPTIVRPSSLNYKISLIEAVRNFITKERVGPDQQIEVELEEPTSKKMAHFEVLDDALFDLRYVPKYGKEKSSQNITKNKRDSAHRFENQWDREEEQIRKKLEKNSINLMKSKIAQQARAEQSSNNNQQQQSEQDQQAQAAAGAQQQQVNQPTTVQLSQNQIEEAKQMTQGKLKMYRRDRLYTSDKDRLQNLHDSLKNVRIVDEAAYFNSQPDVQPSPSKGRNRDGPPPIHKAGTKGDRGGGPSAGGGGGGATTGGGGGGGYGFSSGKGNAPGEKGGSANAGKGSEYSYQQNNRQNNRNGGMGSAAYAMDRMGSGEAPRVITGMTDIMEKRSNSKKPKPGSPGKQIVTPQIMKAGTGSQSQMRSSSPDKTTIESAKGKSSPKNQNQRSASRDLSQTKNGGVGSRGIPIPFDENTFTEGMNSLLKSPIKKNLHQVPFRQGQTGSAKLQAVPKTSSTSIKGAVMANHTNMMTVTPSAFV